MLEATLQFMNWHAPVDGSGRYARIWQSVTPPSTFADRDVVAIERVKVQVIPRRGLPRVVGGVIVVRRRRGQWWSQ